MRPTEPLWRLPLGISRIVSRNQILCEAAQSPYAYGQVTDRKVGARGSGCTCALRSTDTTYQGRNPMSRKSGSSGKKINGKYRGSVPPADLSKSRRCRTMWSSHSCSVASLTVWGASCCLLLAEVNSFNFFTQKTAFNFKTCTCYVFDNGLSVPSVLRDPVCKFWANSFAL